MGFYGWRKLPGSLRIARSVKRSKSFYSSLRKGFRMKKILVAAMSALVLCAAVYAADEVKLDGVNCVVANSKAAKAGNSTDYKGGKVYFCCMNCPKAFAKDPAKFATKANAQL